MKTLNTTVEVTNNLIYTATKKVINKFDDKFDIVVTVRLNDECKNGHQDFSITGTTYKPGLRSDRATLSGGCIHDEILKHFPEFKIFIDLHLCDFNGVHMYIVENGFHHLKHGFNNILINSDNFISKFCNYYDITPKEYNNIKDSVNKIDFYLRLTTYTNYINRRKEKANKAREMMEELTGKQFLNDSKRTQLNAPSDEDIKEFNKQVESGYFLPKAVRARERAKARQIIDKKIIDVQKEIKSLKNEIEAIKALFKVGGLKAINNHIFYNHTQTISLNWKGYEEQMTTQELKYIFDAIKLPEGVKIEISKESKYKLN